MMSSRCDLNVTCGDEMSITVNGKDIMQPENLKLLGVTLDCGLNFNGNICKKASQSIGAIMRLTNLTPTANYTSTK